MTPIEDLLAELKLERFAPVFAEQQIDLETLLLLSEADLRQLELPLGPRARLLRAIADLKTQSAQSTDAEELRCITLLFCDVVGSTTLAQDLNDPELIRQIKIDFQRACADVVAAYEGRIYEKRTEEIVAAFGHPHAHEDDPARAVHAGLELIQLIPSLPLPGRRRLDVRVTVTTGRAIVEPDGAVTGGVDTMNLAERLKSVTAPGTMVVSDKVRRLAGGHFQYEDLGGHPFKGFSGSVRAWRVCGHAASASRFDATTEHRLSPLVGRRVEIGTLLERWEQARAGHGRVVLLTGDAGIGKSRLMKELTHRVEIDDTGSLTFQCSPYHTRSAFHPLIDNLQRTLRLDRDTPQAVRLERLEAMLRHQGRPLDDVALIASLLSITIGDRYPQPNVTPRRYKELTIDALVGIVEATVAGAPHVMFFEDAHWADPSSLETLHALIARVHDLPLLFVISARSRDVFETWAAHRPCEFMHLSELTAAESAELIEKLPGGQELSPSAVAEIVTKASGVPLFVEAIVDSVEGQRRSGAHSSISVPDTLEGLLQTNLDAIGWPVKEIAQIGSVIGREFSYELLSAATSRPPAVLDDALARLAESGLALRRERGAQATFTFKHALVRDAAYQSMTTERRKEWHGRIATVIETKFPESCEREPELLAQHYQAADSPESNEKAVSFWLRAGERSRKRFALSEAITHLNSGLELVDRLPPEHAGLAELKLRTQLGPAIFAQAGWASTHVSDVLERAWVLAESLEHSQSYLPILHGLWVNALTVGNLQKSVYWAEQMLAASRSSQSSALEVSAHRALLASQFWLGNLASARQHADQVESLYDARLHFHIADLTNTDPLTMVGIYASHYLWMLGHPEEAIAGSDRKDDHARRRNHPFDLGFALTLGSHAFDYCRRPDDLFARAREAEAVGRDRGVTLMSGIMAQIIKGVALLRSGQVAASVRQLEESIGNLERTGHRIYVKYLRAVLADAKSREGRRDEAIADMDAIVAAIDNRHDWGERVHLAEILRLRGIVRDQQGNHDAAEQDLLRALATARDQRATSWVLRTATSLARLWQAHGRLPNGRQLLESALGAFDRPSNTADFTDAQRLLVELESSSASSGSSDEHP